MGFWKHILSYFDRETNGGKSKGGGATSELCTEGFPLFVYGDSTAMCVATVFRCVKLLSESVANLPLRYVKHRDGVFVDAGDRRLDYLLNVQPDVSVNAFDFRRQLVTELLLEGNAYIVPVYNIASFKLDRLALCARGTVSHDTLNDTYTVYDTENGIYGTFEESEIIHIKGLTLRNSKRGVSVLTYARLTASIAATADKETQKRFANGGTVKGLVSNDRSLRGYGEYQDTELQKTAADLNRRYNIEGENIVASPGQTGFTQISMSSVDMQFLESRKFTVIEICRFFSVPPTFVYADTSNNYKTVEQADVDFLSHTLNPLLRNIEIELRRKLIAPQLAHKYKFEFDRRELFACDLNGMMNYGTKLLQLGTTINEVRQMNGLPAVGGGDAVMVSANLRGIDEIGAKPVPAQPAPKNPEGPKIDNNDKDPEEKDEEK